MKVGIVMAAILVGAMVTLFKQPMLLFVVFLIVSVSWLYILKRQKYVLTFLIVAIAGFLLETMSVHYGVWNFRVSQFAGLSYWLFPAWGCVGLSIVTLWEYIDG